MTNEMFRREFLKTGGALVVGFSLRDTLVAQEQVVRGTKPGPPDARQVDTWLAIHADNPNLRAGLQRFACWPCRSHRAPTPPSSRLVPPNRHTKSLPTSAA